MTTATVTPLTDQDALFKHYDGQMDPQDCHLALDLEDGELTADYNPEIGTGVPMSVFHGLTRWIPLPGPLTNEAANALLEEAKPLAQRILDGAAVGWDGNNNVATLDDDAQRAEEELTDLAATYDEPGYLIGEMTAREWFSEGDPPAGVTADSTDEELDAIADRESAEARTVNEGVTILTDVSPYLTSLRQEMRERVYAELADVAEQIESLEKRRKDTIAQVRGWGIDSLRDIAALARMSHTHVRRLTGDAGE